MAIQTDGLTLPLFSPDGRHLVVARPTDADAALTWDELLALPRPAPAAPDAPAPPAARSVLIYDLSPAPPAVSASSDAGASSPLPPRSPTRVDLPPGSILGRSSSSLGWLIEHTTPSSGGVLANDAPDRAIGLLPWSSAAAAAAPDAAPSAASPSRVAWLLRTPGMVYAWATFLPESPGAPARIAAAERPSDDSRPWTIVLAEAPPGWTPGSAGAPWPIVGRAATDAALLLPFAGNDPGTLFAIAQRPDGTAAVVRCTLAPAQPQFGLRTWDTVLPLRAGTGVRDLYQATAALQSPWPSAAGSEPAGAVIFAPDALRCWWLRAHARPASSGGPADTPRDEPVNAEPLPSRSFVGVPARQASGLGLIIATDRDVRAIVPGGPPGPDWNPARSVRVLGGEAVPRVTRGRLGGDRAGEQDEIWLMVPNSGVQSSESMVYRVRVRPAAGEKLPRLPE